MNRYSVWLKGPYNYHAAQSPTYCATVVARNEYAAQEAAFAELPAELKRLGVWLRTSVTCLNRRWR